MFWKTFGEHPVEAEVPVKAPHVSNDMLEPFRDKRGNDSSDAALSLPLLSLTDDPKGGSESIHTVVYDETRRFPLRKPHTKVGASLPA